VLRQCDIITGGVTGIITEFHHVQEEAIQVAARLCSFCETSRKSSHYRNRFVSTVGGTDRKVKIIRDV
jgi:hypothetical protein